jgi:glycosyltransferase involved in cell wall biosynthesis
MSLAVSVIIPTYNRASLVVRAVKCALAACQEIDEIIVIDDGSTDGTDISLAAYKNKIIYLRTSNGGPGKARNVGVRTARNPLIAFLDSDDEWMPGKLDLQRALMQARSEVVFAFSNFAVRDRLGKEHHDYLVRWHNDPRSWGEILGAGTLFSQIAPLPNGQHDFSVHIGDLYPSEMVANYVFTSTLIVRREAAKEALWFAEDLPLYEDWECYGKLARAGPAAYLDCETAWQSDHGGPRLTDADTIRHITSRLVVLDRVWGTDAAFQATHGDRFRQIITEQRLKKIRGLLNNGQMDEARQELCHAKGSPLLYRFLSCLPGPLVRGLTAIRHKVYLANRLILK